jgi:hypothetical protein
MQRNVTRNATFYPIPALVRMSDWHCVEAIVGHFAGGGREPGGRGRILDRGGAGRVGSRYD